MRTITEKQAAEGLEKILGIPECPECGGAMGNPVIPNPPYMSGRAESRLRCISCGHEEKMRTECPADCLSRKHPDYPYECEGCDHWNGYKFYQKPCSHEEKVKR